MVPTAFVTRSRWPAAFLRSGCISGAEEIRRILTEVSPADDSVWSDLLRELSSGPEEFHSPISPGGGVRMAVLLDVPERRG